MPADDGTEPIADDEILYRRIPKSMGWYDPDKSPSVSPLAFNPSKRDEAGISIYRDKFKSVEEAAQGWPGKTYFIAVLRAGDLKKRGIEVSPDPQENDPGHASIPSLNYSERKEDKAREAKVILADELTLRVEGPFSS